MYEPSPVLLYLHIPKAAGTTLGSLLFDQMRSHDCPDAGIHGFHSGVFYYPATFTKELDAASESLVRQALVHDGLRAVLGHLRFGLHASLSRPYRYVTILREPVSRVRSLYEFQRLNERKYGKLAGIRLPEDVDLARYVLEPPYAEVDNGMTRRISGLSPPVGGCTTEMLSRAKTNLQEHFAVVGLTERFDESLILMSRLLGWAEVPIYYPMNVNTRRHEEVNLDPAISEVVRSQNTLDVELYRFATDLFSQRISEMDEEFFHRTLDYYRDRKQTWYKMHGLQHPQTVASVSE